MLIYFIFSSLIFIHIKCDSVILLDKLFKNNYEIEDLSMKYCPQYDEDSLLFKGKPENIKDILNSNKNNNLEKYKYVYITDKKYLKEVTLFPHSTKFFVLESIANSALFNENYCYFEIKMKFSNYKTLYYIIVGKEITKDNEELIIAILIIFFLITNIFVIMLNIKSCCLSPFEQIFHYDFTKAAISLANACAISCTLITHDLLSYLMYSFYKSYIIINLFFLVDGFTTVHYDYIGSCIFFKHLLYFFLFDSLSSIFFLYIVFFIPSLSNFYFFALKNWILHLVLLLYTIKCIKLKFIPLYRQYQFEKRRKTFFVIGYKLKIIIYLKILIFTIIYCLVFILLPFIEIIYSLNKYAEAFYYSYYFNAGCEMFLGFILSIMYFPVRISFLYNLPVYYDYNSRRFVAKISKENEKINDISNLTKNTLKKHKKENMPIVLISPYSDKNIYNKLHIGSVEI